MSKTLRTIQPAHKSDRITVQQAMKAWRKVEGKNGSKAPATSTPKGDSTRGKGAADHRK